MCLVEYPDYLGQQDKVISLNLEDVHLAQAINYLEAYELEIGLLLNFGAKSLQYKRVHNNAVIKQSSNQVIL